jgi:hypothetical protein
VFYDGVGFLVTFKEEVKILILLGLPTPFLDDYIT